MSQSSFTQGKIFGPLIKFAIPVLLAAFLQSLYGAVDLLVVGQYATSADVSAVSTGSQIMTTITNAIAGLAMGTTILLGQLLGEEKKEEAGKAVGTSIIFFACLAVIFSIICLLNVSNIAKLMNAPQEAFSATCDYIRICSSGMIFIVAYNLLGSLFRGLGNSKIPLITVAIAAVINIFGDIFLVDRLKLGAAGAAYATVASQAISVILSFLFIRKMEMPFSFSKKDITFNKYLIGRIVGFGFPIALADTLVGLSFLIIIAIVNVLGVTASAGVGVAEKVCAFIMLVPSAFSQSIAAFVAQNYGARKMDRAFKGLKYGLILSIIVGLIMAYVSFFHGDILCGIFSKDEQVIAQGWQYLKAYGIDCILTPFFFCFVGFFNGCGYTKFVMAQGIIGAFCVRVPVSFVMSKIQPVSLFRVGLATPCSSLVQLLLCLGYMFIVVKKKQQSYNQI